MRKEVIICDGCGKEKGPVNHWFTRIGNHFGVRKGVDPSYNRHFCSQQCVTAAFQQWMDAEGK